MRKITRLLLMFLVIIVPATASALQYELSFTADVVGLEAAADWSLGDITGGTSIGNVSGSVVYTVPAINTDEDTISFTYNVFSEELGLDISWVIDDALWTLDSVGFASGSLDYSGGELSGEGALVAFVDAHYPWNEGAISDSLLPTTFNLADWDYGLFGYVGAGISCAGADFAGIAGKLTTASVAPVPEPATILLLGAGLIGIAGYGRKRLLKK